MNGSSQTYVYDATDALCKELAARWREGDTVPVESYLERLGEQPDSENAVRLVYEEICLRQERGEQVALAELEARFPRWAQELAILLDCHQLIRTHHQKPLFPQVGEVLGDFRLINELGRGAQGIVYLARQQTLSDRPVVLKLAPRKTREHLSLASLQHTHIIPLHAIYEFPGHELIALCQPYLGGMSLERLLSKLQELPAEQRTGQSILNILDEETKVKGQAGSSSFRRILARSSYEEAVCLIGACLAEGMHYAHEHDLIHLDIKPSNVLITADAQPLLLDFHLAVQPLRVGAQAPEWFGGTRGYLAPEHAAACEASQRGQPVPASIGATADIYSLGKVLYVALDGCPASDVPDWRESRMRISTGMKDIIAKCLHPNASQRYETAAMLANDLRRHMASQLLVGVPNRSWKERWKKWARRTPYRPLVAAIVLTLLAAATMVIGVMYYQFQGANQDVRHARQQLAEGLHREALYSLEQGQGKIWLIPWSHLHDEIQHTMQLSKQAQATELLNTTTDRLRYLAEDSSRNSLHASLELACRTIWEQRELILKDRPVPELHNTFLDFVTLWISSWPKDSASKQEVLAECERLLPGLTSGNGQPSTWLMLSKARNFLQSGDATSARRLVQQLVELHPGDFWPNYFLGHCCYLEHDYQAALRWFSVALALRPRSPECHYHLGLVSTALEQLDQAMQSYNKALELRPNYGAARLNRGHIQYQLKHYQNAREDFEQALLDDADPRMARYNLALAFSASGQNDLAIEQAKKALELQPEYQEAKQLLSQLQVKTSAKGPKQ